MRARKSKNKIDEYNQEIKDLKEELGYMEQELREQVDKITLKWDQALNDIEEYSVTARKTDIRVDEPKIVWVYKKY